jgi:hypothetical protein
VARKEVVVKKYVVRLTGRNAIGGSARQGSTTAGLHCGTLLNSIHARRSIPRDSFISESILGAPAISEQMALPFS